jgi:hypothetical protein
MPPRQYSRHLYCLGYQDQLGDHPVFMRARIPFRYQQRSDNILVVAKSGDTFYSLAGRYYSSLPRGCGLWWAIADFQPQPVHDPTLQLAAGQVVVVPSLRTVLEEVFDDSRVLESEA